MTELSPTYVLLLTMGEEGPYTREELCGLLRRGKARADDRLREVSTGTAILIAEVIPEAAELMKLAPPISDRIRRKSSDRQPSVVHAQPSDHPAIQDPTPGNLTTPDQIPATNVAQSVKDRLRRTSEIIAVAASEVATEINPTATHGDRWRGVKIIVSLIAIPLSLWWIWDMLNPSYPKAYPLRGMAWSTLVTPGKPPVADVRVLIREEQLQITWEGKTSVHGMTMESGNAGLTFSLVPAHPHIGEKILLVTGHDIPVLVTTDGKRIPLRQE